MKNLLLTLLIGFLFSVNLHAQQYFTELNGFKLRQYRQVPANEFDEPGRTGKHENGWEWDAYALEDDGSVYMVFEYAPDAPELIWSIQMTGTDPSYDLGILGLRLGMTAAEVQRLLGTPSKKEDIAEHGTRWEFKKFNFSIEINPAGKLSSVKLREDVDREPKADLKKLPRYDSVLKTLTTGSNSELAKMLSPDMELYRDGKTLYFRRSMRNEIAGDSSKIFATIRELSPELRAVNSRNASEYDENMRLTQGQDPKHVIKFAKTAKVRELVFKTAWGQYLLWEFDAGRPVRDELAVYTPRTLKELTTVMPDALIKNPNVVLYDSKKNPDIRLSYESYTSRVKVIYTGASRKLVDRRKAVIELWLTTLGKSKELLDLFETEYLFKEDGAEYWLPVQEAAAAKLAKDLNKGDSTMLFVAWLGGRHEPKGFDNVIIVNDIRKE